MSAFSKFPSELILLLQTFFCRVHAHAETLRPDQWGSTAVCQGKIIWQKCMTRDPALAISGQ